MPGPLRTARARGVPEDGDLRAARLVLPRAEAAAQHGPHAQHVEEARAHRGALEPRRRAAAGHRHAVAVDGGQRLEGLRLRLDVEEVLRRVDTVSGPPRPARSDEPVGLGERQRLQQDCVDDAEDRAVRADAEGQRRDGHEREAGRLPQPSQRVDEVLAQGVHGLRAKANSVPAQPKR